MADDEVPSDSSLLVVIVDTNPNQRYITEDPKLLTNCLDAVIAFSNSHLMQKSMNQLAVIGCHFHKSEYLYPSPGKPLDVRQIDGQYELFTLVEKTVKTRLVNLVKSQPADEKPGESLLAGALAMALCFIAKIRRQASLGLRMSSRILIVTGSSDTAAQYINYMNVFFTAQKQQVLIDVCSLDKHLSLLQQGCDITGGLYLQVPSLERLLQYLLWVFLPEASERGRLVLPGRGRVDYRAACFCHRDLLTIGYVCSVCLSVLKRARRSPDVKRKCLSITIAVVPRTYRNNTSPVYYHCNSAHYLETFDVTSHQPVFCKFSPICTTCHTVFKIGGPLPMKPKKKKIKL